MKRLSYLLRSNNEKVGLSLILIIAFALRVFQLGKPDLWMDELGQATAAIKPLPRMLFVVQKHHGAAPLDYLITMMLVRWSRLAGVLRTPAALWGTLTVYWVYRLGQLLGNLRVGLIAATLAAVNVFLLRYAQELRFYALFVLLTLITTELVWRAWQQRTWRDWLLYGGVVTLLYYAHYFGLLATGLHGLWIMALSGQALYTNRAAKAWIVRQWLAFLAAVGGAALLFAPWAVYDLSQEKGLPHPPLPELSLTWVQQLLHVMAGRVDAWWLWLGLAFIGLLLSFRKSWPTGLFLSAALLLTPILVLWIDRRQNYFFHPRQIIFLLPYYLILAAWGVDGIANWLALHIVSSHRGWVQIGLAGSIVTIMLSLNVPILKNYYEIAQIRREDIAYQPLTDVTAWRGAAELVEANWREGDRLIFLARHDTASIPFYLPSSLRKQGVLIENLSLLQNLYEERRPMWVVYTPMIRLTPEAEAMKDWLQKQPALHFSLPGNVHVYLLQEGLDAKQLWEQRLRTGHLPPIAYLWAAYGRAIRSLDHEAAMQAFEKAAALSDYIRPRKDYFIPSDYAGVSQSPAGRDIIVETRADYLAEAAHEALMLGQADLALRYLAKAEALDTENPHVALQKGWALLQLGRADEAIATLRYARETLNLQNPWLDIFLGRAYTQKGEYHQAIQSYQEALQYDPNLHQARYALGSAYEALGERDKAAYWYQNYLDYTPNGPLAEQARQHLQTLSD